MPWEKQFDVDQALAKAMQAFWARGYEATSMQDLVTCMGLNRGSLYATFGDKRSLFIQALRHYRTVHLHDWVAALSRAHGPRDTIIAAFDQAIATVVEGGSRDGCLLVNTALELSPHDEEVSEFVSACLIEMEAFFRNTIEHGQAAGEIPDTFGILHHAHQDQAGHQILPGIDTQVLQNRSAYHALTVVNNIIHIFQIDLKVLVVEERRQGMVQHLGRLFEHGGHIIERRLHQAGSLT